MFVCLIVVGVATVSGAFGSLIDSLYISTSTMAILSLCRPQKAHQFDGLKKSNVILVQFDSLLFDLIKREISSSHILCFIIDTNGKISVNMDQRNCVN